MQCCPQTCAKNSAMPGSCWHHAWHSKHCVRRATNPLACHSRWKGCLWREIRSNWLWHERRHEMAYNKLQDRLIMSHPSANSSNRNAESSYLHSEDWIINILKFNLILKGTNMANKQLDNCKERMQTVMDTFWYYAKIQILMHFLTEKKKTKSIK